MVNADGTVHLLGRRVSDKAALCEHCGNRQYSHNRKVCCRSMEMEQNKASFDDLCSIDEFLESKYQIEDSTIKKWVPVALMSSMNEARFFFLWPANMSKN